MMKTQIKYIASSGNVYNLTTQDILHRTGDYYNWSWKPEGAKKQHGTRVSRFSREAAQYSPELILRGKPAELRQLVQALHNDFENDLRNMTPGRIVWGDYYIDCYITSSSVEHISFWTWLSNKIQIYAPYPYWIKEDKIVLSASAESASTFLDYPYDYPYDYTAPTIGEKIVKSDAPFASEFVMVIYGEAVNPRIVINGHPYVLYTTVPAGAYVVIDSKQRTIMMYANDGTKTNVFDFRNKTDSIFEKIPAGNLTITWDASFGADITIFREKAEPDFEEIQ